MANIEAILLKKLSCQLSLNFDYILDDLIFNYLQ